MKILRSIGEINGLVCSGQIGSYINSFEEYFDSRAKDIAKELYDEMGSSHVALIAGPSSSGKTTFTLKLERLLKEMGAHASTVSLDNFFLTRNQVPKNENGEPDFESVHALDLDEIGRRFGELAEKGHTLMPAFDFITGKRVAGAKEIHLKPNSIFLIEGLHAMNGLVEERMPGGHAKKIYISLPGGLEYEGRPFADSADLRLMRRMVRDYRYRGSSPDNTFKMWEEVLKGDIKYVKPFKPRADIKVESFFPYEAGVLKPYVEKILDALDPNSPYQPKKEHILSLLDKVLPIESALVPETSLTREFFGGSLYHRS